MHRPHLAYAALSVLFVQAPVGARSAELIPGRTEIRGSADYRDTVDRFLKGIRPKVVGGSIAPEGAYPWQISLVVSWIADASRGHFCGGSIYDRSWIVTAAHCVDTNQPEDIHVVSGSNIIGQNSPRINVKRIIVHKSYNASSNDNDIALLELLEPLSLSAGVQAIELLDATEEDASFATGKMLTVTGWGATVEGGGTVKNLRFVDVPPVTRDVCNRPESYDGSITDNMICAGRALGGTDSCQGDSGGPLVTDKSAGLPKLAGIVSFGEGCARPAKFGVYTRVTRYKGWINQCVASPKSC